VSQTIKWKYFFPVNEQPHSFASGDLVFVSGKYVVENSEQCITVTYASTIDDENPNREFDTSNVPTCVPHCMFSVTVNRKPKELDEFIHFGVESVEYNPVTGTPDVKMQMTVLYSCHSTRFQKYLGASGSNIKLRTTYFVSGLFKFSQSGKMVIEATDIDYLKTSNANYIASESSSSVLPGARSIIDIVADDIDSITTQSPFKQPGINSPRCEKKPCYETDYVDLDTQDNEKEYKSDYERNNELGDEGFQDDEEELEENLQPRKRKR
ncbi:965_t:CDS:2, partial [Racocetra persica]